MSLQGEQILLRVYLQSADRAPHTPTYERLITAARSAQLAGATVFRGIMGFGDHGIIEASSWHIVEHVPVIVEIVDSAEKIKSFIEGPMDQHMIAGVATLERANVMLYRHRSADPPGALKLGPLLRPLSTLPEFHVSPHMTISNNGVLLRIFIGDSDRSPENKPLHEAIITKARELGLAGATVLRGIEGFGAHSVLHRAHLLEMSTDLAMVIEIVDVEEKIELLLPYLESAVREGMITMEHVAIIAYRNRHGQQGFEVTPTS